uniref:MAM domain-containing protein n=1 Tax=Periophthalmus magnuspinnatus TaxID=409849 RepID=A0A3B4A356_9GOBI
MFGPTVGSLRMMWEKSGNHGDQWLLMQNHVTAKTGRQLILEATIGGEAGNIAIDDVSLTAGSVCDFEEDSCGWRQDSTDDLEWVRQFGYSGKPGPHTDHTTNIVVEGVLTGPSDEGGIAFDDVHLTEAHCPPLGHCDFETNLCSWINVLQIDQADWLRGTGAGPESNTGPPVDHTTNSSYYVYVDSSVGHWGDQSFLISEVFQPSARGHCITFWYHMYGERVGTLRLHINDRTHETGNVEGMLKWEERGNKGKQWNKASVTIKHNEPF